MQVHLNALQAEEAVEGELSLTTLKKFIAFCRTYVLPSPPPSRVGPCTTLPSPYRRCGPRLSAEAADKLKNRYVMMRGGARQHERDTARKTAIPITVRQLEAIIRIAEALAKLSLSPFALASHVDEALRLFRVSTLDAAMSGSLSGEFTSFSMS